MRKYKMFFTKIYSAVLAFLLIIPAFLLQTENFKFAAKADDLEPTEKYYLMCKDSDFEINENYLLTLNQKNSDFQEYIYTITVNKAISFSYYILESFTHTKYYPNSDGYVDLAETGDYTVKFSLSNVYLSEGSGANAVNFYTGVEINTYDGLYLMSNINEYRYKPSDAAFVEKYKFQIDLTKSGYTYKLSLEISNKILSAHSNKVDFYISDGANQYMAPQGQHFVITQAGIYDIYFAEPDSNQDNASVYTFMTKSYLPSEQVREIAILDSDNNYVYIEGENLTSDMTASIVQRGKYKFVEIRQDGKIVEFGQIKITYYVGAAPEKYEVYCYENKLETLIESEIFGNNIVFELKDETGFYFYEKEQAISLMYAIVLAATAGIVVIIASVIISTIVKRSRMKKENPQANGSE